MSTERIDFGLVFDPTNKIHIQVLESYQYDLDENGRMLKNWTKSKRKFGLPDNWIRTVDTPFLVSERLWGFFSKVSTGDLVLRTPEISETGEHIKNVTVPNINYSPTSAYKTEDWNKTELKMLLDDAEYEEFAFFLLNEERIDLPFDRSSAKIYFHPRLKKYFMMDKNNVVLIITCVGAYMLRTMDTITNYR